MHHHLKLILCIIALFISLGLSAQKGYEIKVKIPNLKNKEILLAHYLGSQSAFADDTIKLDKTGMGYLLNAFIGIIVAIIIASPLTWYFMDQWLQNFAYRINISWVVFALVGILSITLSILTISFQSIKTAIANPMKNLRTE